MSSWLAQNKIILSGLLLPAWNSNVTKRNTHTRHQKKHTHTHTLKDTHARTHARMKTFYHFEGNVSYQDFLLCDYTWPHCPMYKLKMKLEEKYVWRCELNLKDVCNVRLHENRKRRANGCLWIVTPVWQHFSKAWYALVKRFLPGTKPSGLYCRLLSPHFAVAIVALEASIRWLLSKPTHILN